MRCPLRSLALKPKQLNARPLPFGLGMKAAVQEKLSPSAEGFDQLAYRTEELKQRCRTPRTTPPSRVLVGRILCSAATQMCRIRLPKFEENRAAMNIEMLVS